MGKSLLLLVMLLVYGSLVLILPEAAVAPWEPSGTIGVVPVVCENDGFCGTGNECFNFQCQSCSGSCGACKTWQAGGGCGCVNAFEGVQDGCSSGWWCESGTCINCHSPGGSCPVPICCAGSLCDTSNSACVQCDANHVQTNPAVAQGGGKCEQDCGASSQCDEQPVGAFVASGICNPTCQYVDGDPSPSPPPPDCTTAVGPGRWSIGGEVAATTCCGDDPGEKFRSRETGCTILPSCAPNDYPEFATDATDDACCNVPDDAVFSSACFTHDNGAPPGGPYLYSGGAVSVAAGAVVPNMIAENGKWYDCDNSLGACTESKSTGRCGLTWVAGGEAAAFGEYATGTSTECCGDDAGESSHSRETGCTKPVCSSNDYPEFAPSAGDAVCCNDPNDAVFSSACFTHDNGAPPGGPYLYSGGAVSVAAGAVVPNMIAENGKWYDCDNSLGACTEAKSTGRCGLTWAAGGESASFGEYDTGTSTECCGDDAGENYRSTLKGVTTYSACCNLATDCVDVGNSCVPTGTMTGGFKCVGGGWIDGDVSEVACGAAVGVIPGSWSLGPGSEVAATTCCGDDTGEYNRFRDCTIGSCLDNPADKKCCNADKDCVFSGQCFYDVDTAVSLVQAENTAFCTGKNENACTSGASKVKCTWTGSNCVAAATRASVQFSQKTGGSYFAYADINSDGSDEVCVAASPGQWEGSTFGSVSGIVSNLTHPAVQGAVVRVLGTSLTATTAADGSYTITNVLTGYHDLVASKSEYEASSVNGVFIPDGETINVDFMLIHSAGNCEDDCTLVGSNLCDASCHGKGLCWFYSDATKAACDGTFGIIEMPGGLTNVDCCKGQPYSPIKADITVPSKNVIVTKKPVLYHGKFINMVMVVFNR